LAIPRDQLEWSGCGVNHQVFLTRLEHRGADVYPRLRALAHEDSHFAGTVRADLLRRLGYFVTESSEHNAEYCSWYLPWDEQVAARGLEPNPYWRRRAENAELFALAGEYAYGDAGLALADLLPSGEYAPQIIRSLVTGDERHIYVNVPNRQDDGTILVAELQPDGVVEVPAHCDAAGIHPRSADPLPPQCAALNRRYLDVCDLAVRAVVEGRRDHVHHAALLDPNTSATLEPDRIADLVDELLAAHETLGYLPETLRSTTR
jgi:alpha-galactosidase